MAEQHNLPAQRLIYQTCDHMFAGYAGHIRSRKSIKSVLHRFQCDPGYMALLRDYAAESIREVIFIMLEKGLFADPELARAKWPSPFEPVATSRPNQRAILEAEASLTSQATLDDGSSRSSDESDTESVQAADPVLPLQKLTLPTPIVTDTVPTGVPDRDRIELKFPEWQACKLPPSPGDHLAFPSLYPLHLTYRAQHYVMTAALHSLERCYHKWILRWAPDGIAAYQHDYSESIEIKPSIELMIERIPALSKGKLGAINNGKYSAILWETLEIRHVATHRVPIASSKVLDLLDAAIKAADLLKDYCEEAQITKLKAFAQIAHNKMDRKSSALTIRIRGELADIEDQRLALLKLREAKLLQYLEDNRSSKISVDEDLRLAHLQAQSSALDIVPHLAAREERSVEGTVLQLENRDSQEQERAPDEKRGDRSEAKDVEQMLRTTKQELELANEKFGKDLDERIRSFGKNIQVQPAGGALESAPSIFGGPLAVPTASYELPEKQEAVTISAADPMVEQASTADNPAEIEANGVCKPADLTGDLLKGIEGIDLLDSKQERPEDYELPPTSPSEDADDAEELDSWSRQISVQR